MHIAYMCSTPRGVGLLMARVSNERSVQLEYVGVGYSDSSTSVLGRSEMVETMAGKVLCTKPVLPDCWKVPTLSSFSARDTTFVHQS